MSDTAWPCACGECAPDSECLTCGARSGEVCKPDCSEHPGNRAPCEPRRLVEPEPKIAKGES